MIIIIIVIILIIIITIIIIMMIIIIMILIMTLMIKYYIIIIIIIITLILSLSLLLLLLLILLLLLVVVIVIIVVVFTYFSLYLFWCFTPITRVLQLLFKETSSYSYKISKCLLLPITKIKNGKNTKRFIFSKVLLLFLWRDQRCKGKKINCFTSKKKKMWRWMSCRQPL